MTGPENQPGTPHYAADDAARAQTYPQAYGDPAAQYTTPRTTHDSSYITDAGELGYPAYEPYPGGPHGGPGVAHYPGGPGYQPGYAPFPGGPGYGSYPPAPVRMPGSVRAAQILSFVAAALGLVLIVLIGAMGGPEALGRATAGFSLFLVLGGLACAFQNGSDGVRIGGIVVGSMTALCGLGSMAGQAPPSLLGMLIGGAVAILLAQKSARDWFHRPR
ncbi:hypothetical protein ACFWUP_27100 [Nocardia sp. NPDC058658]|uniref:hypothetical protein n=1 Tax=Nocardia sp. NPDC058658 TaxID=3346580 RepID=UPI00364B575B